MITPHGGRLVEREIRAEAKKEVLEELKTAPKLEVDKELAKEVENIALGVFSPLEGFMNLADVRAVFEDMRLVNGTPWTIPIVFPISKEKLQDIKEGVRIALVYEGQIFAFIDAEEIFEVAPDEYAEAVFGTLDRAHPGVDRVFKQPNTYISGKVTLIERLPDPFARYRLTPKETRVLFKEKGWNYVVGFQTRNIPHLGHEYIQKTALTFVDGLFINPIIGRKKKGDFRDEVIIATYEELIKHYYLKERAVMAVLETEMRYAGPREAIFHAIVRKNFGCTHFIVGRDHAGVGNFYAPDAAHKIFDRFPDLGITPVVFNAFFYCKRCGGVVNEKICPHSPEEHINFSGTKIRQLLTDGKIPDATLMRPEVAKVVLSFDKIFVE